MQNDRMTVTPVIEVTALGTELARQHPDNRYTTSNVGVIGTIERSNNGKNAVLRVGRVNPNGASWSQTEFICLVPREREQLIQKLIETRRYRAVHVGDSGRWAILDTLSDDLVQDGPQDNLFTWAGTEDEAAVKAAQLNLLDEFEAPPARHDTFQAILARYGGNKVEAGIVVGQGLMRGDTASFKAGYSRDAAVLAVTKLYELTENEAEQVRDGLPEEPDF